MASLINGDGKVCNLHSLHSFQWTVQSATWMHFKPTYAVRPNDYELIASLIPVPSLGTLYSLIGFIFTPTNKTCPRLLKWLYCRPPMCLHVPLNQIEIHSSTTALRTEGTATEAWPSWNSITVWESVLRSPSSSPSPQTRVILTLTFLFLKLLLSHPFSLSPSSHTKKAPSSPVFTCLLLNHTSQSHSHTRLLLYDVWKQMCVVGNLRGFMFGATYIQYNTFINVTF